MNSEEKFKIITEGKHYGISKVCKKYNISRTLYYRWLKRYEMEGILGLEPIKKTTVPSNKTKPEIVTYVLNLIKEYPNYGPRALSYLVEEAGYKLSESAIYNILKRHKLTTKEQRFNYFSKRKKKKTPPLPNFNDLKSGQCWIFYTIFYGDFKEVGPLYEYTFYDYKSKITCSRLYQTLSFEHFEDLLTAVAMPVSQTLKFDTQDLCFFIDEPLLNRKNNFTNERLMRLLENCNFNLSVHKIQIGEIYTIAKSNQQAYTKHCLSYLLDKHHEKTNLKSLRFSMQEHVRNYNLHHRQTYHTGIYTPIEYHVISQEVDIILPLWAYIDREY